MVVGTKRLVAIAALACTALAFPSFGVKSDAGLEKRYDGFSDNLAQRLQKYTPPGPNDSRGPCPALNTLANHGLINHDGKNINSTDLVTAFARGFGIAFDGIATALHNFEVVCEYVSGKTCGTPANDGTFILTNLTLLGLRHAFEHDHSFSRQDYYQNYAHGKITDNIYFNSSEFQNSLDVVGYKPSNPPTKKLAGYRDFNEIRLQREAQQYKADVAGTFQQNIPVQLFEVGFIFGATFDRDSSGNMIGAQPSVRLDWWNFWFSEESFPTQLGWVPAHTSVFKSVFISSVSSAVLAATATSTPSGLPPGALVTTAAGPTNLPEGDPSSTFPLFQGTAYIAPTAPSAIKSETYAKREAEPAAATVTAIPTAIISAVASEATANPAVITSALSIVGPAPPKYDFYQQSVDINSLKAQLALAKSYESAVVAAVTSLAGITA